MAALNYTQSGVNIAAADQLVSRIAKITKQTKSPRVKSTIGGYASLFALNAEQWLAASTDGVGTKLKLAFRLRKHDTVGIDLVAMSVNDLLCVGAEPLFFLDYLATSELDVGVAEQVIKGIASGCRQAGCALVGGETAEMPGFYSKGEYDLAGFAVGIVKKQQVLPVKSIRVGDVLIGIGSSGVHSNGFSLLRKILPDGGEGHDMARTLLTPTHIYSRAFKLLRGKVKGCAHITGGGIDNVARLSAKVGFEIEFPPRGEVPSVFNWVREASKLPFSDLARTFNMGLGIVAVAESKLAGRLVKKLNTAGEKAWIVGEVTRPGKKRVVFRDSP